MGITDPHRGLQVVRDKVEGGAGKRVKLVDIIQHKNHAECFNGVFGMSSETRDYPATLFRFPLRDNACESKISQNCYTLEKVRTNLFASLQEEAPILLLFLRNVVKVSMYEWSEQSDGPECLFTMEIKGNISQNREYCTELAKSYVPTSDKTSVVVSSVSTTCEPPIYGSEVYHWLVLNAIGSDCEVLRGQAQNTSVLPWVGIAAPIPTDLNLQPLQFDLDSISDTSGFTRAISGFNEKICEAHNESSIDGQAFCFLPLPGKISLPVNVHGYFAVADNRRSIKWPSHDEKGDEAKWNELLLSKLVSPVYALMLACRKCLVVYSELTSDAYAAWPVYAEVKNQQIWSHIVDPVLDKIVDLPILWAETAHGFSYVKVNEASFIDPEQSPPPIVTRKLVDLGWKVVQLPQKIFETVLSNDKLKGIVKDLYINPYMVRKALKGKEGLLCSNENEEVYDLLKYVLRGKPSLDSLRDLEVLPLEADSEFATINGNQVFLFSQKNKDALEFLPGISSSIIDVNMPPDLQIVLEELTGQGQSSLTLVTKEIVCSHLLPSSMKSWYPNLDVERKCLWKPSVSHHPPQEWIHDIWLWIQTQNAVENISNIPLVPTEVVSNSTKEVTLVPLNISTGLCTLPSERLSCSQNELLSIVRKMGLIHIPKSDCVFSCPGAMKYIKYIDAHFLLEHIGKLQFLSLTDSDRDCLLEYLSCDLLSSTLTQEEVDSIKSLPIFKAGVGGSPSCYVSLNMAQYILPPHGLPFENDIKYPPNILYDDISRVTALLEKLQITRIISVDEFCHKVILLHIPQNIELIDNDECLIMWVLQCPLSRPAFLNDFSIIKPCVGNIPRKPSELYDPHDNIFLTLFDREKDPVFPDSKYDSVLHVLRQAGLINWAHISSKRDKMVAFFTERMQSMSSLSKSKALEMSKHLLQFVINHGILENFRDIQFLFPQQTPPDGYPLSLEWCGEGCQRPLCPRELCATESEAFVVGSVVPVISREYKIHERSAEFHQVSSKEIVHHFQKVVLCKPNSEEDWDNVHNVIMKVYHSLMTASSVCNFPDAWIWWRSQKLFLRPSQCVFSLPPDIGSLEPYLFNLSVNPDMLMCVKALLPKMNIHIQGSLTSEIAIAVLKQMREVKGNKLTNEDIQKSIQILQWLKSSGSNVSGDVLIPTSLKTLASVSECTYDDRNWNTKVQKSKYTFVHEDVSPALAKHFQVVPLSQKVAPSRNLKIKYTKAGQKEPVTRRIKRIVEDYATNSDIFKELLQNADDAQATEVKFLIDWRHHPTSSLFTDDLASWQGPALIAYNNATFSDQDLEHICELAGETKMKDPLKTGRFGVGFCATYRMTDVPSFISRRYFTMFDPHTMYLGDRVSADEPGMRIDLVENTEDLSVYEDQFRPYCGLFGCDLFNLRDDGFHGTIFRFPFRSYDTANKSNICQEIIDGKSVNDLLQTINKQASHLLLFLKNIQKVTVYILNERDEISNMQRKLEICKECRCSPKCSRLSLLTPSIKSSPTNICHCSIKCKTHNEREAYESSNWIVSSVVSTEVNEKKERGLIPFAEVAIPVRHDKNRRFSPLSVEGYTFCFLPLPKKTGLPFHINGYFEIGRDRSDLKNTDDERFGKSWNDALCKEPLSSAFIIALSELAKMSPLSAMVSEEDKDQYLKSFYKLLKLSDSAGLKSFQLSVSTKFSESGEKLVWSDVEGGKWLSPTEVIILDFLPSVHRILKPAMATLLYLKYKFCKLPDHVRSFLMQHLKKCSKKQVLTCQDFCSEVLLPNLNDLPSDMRDEHITFLLKSLDRHKWIESLLKKYQFVPVEACSILVHPKELINAKKPFMTSLFDPEEGRFPAKFIQGNDLLIFSLRQLGMPKELSVNEIKGRACTVIHIQCKEKAQKRAWSIVAYVQSLYNMSNNQTLRNAVQDVPFLPVASKPHNCQIPWFQTKPLAEPRNIFLPQWNNLLFSVCPVVVPPDEYRLNLSIIGVLAEPPIEYVVSQLLHLSEASESFDDEAMALVSKAVIEIYKFMQSKLCLPNSKDSVAKVKESIGQSPFIWQGNRFLRADQVVMQWNKDQYPYLCSLSSENLKFKELFSLFAVQEKPSAECLAGILCSIAGEIQAESSEGVFGENDTQVSHNIIEFIEEIVKKLCQLVMSDCSELPPDIYLPDEDCVMCSVKSLACDKVIQVGKEDWVQSLDIFTSQFEDGQFHFIHPSIPRERAITLGVKPLLDALVKGLEDEDFMAGMDYGQHEDLCDRLKSILNKYPADHSILNEFLQNADDARATEIVFILDHRKFSKKKLFPSRHQRWKELQETPALLVVNNSKFTEEDIKGIAKLGRGGKQNASDTIGRFGIGFNVTYHITDCPSFVTFSEKGEPQNFCVFDPTCSFANTTKRSPGKRWKISAKVVTDLADQFQPYLLKDIQKPLIGALDKEHVVFRLPLTRKPLSRSFSRESSWSASTYATPYRTHQHSSQVAQEKRTRLGRHFSTSKLKELFKDMESYARDSLLFLNHVQRISVVEITEEGQLLKHFSTHLTMLPEVQTKCTKFANDSKEITKREKEPENLSIMYETEIFHESESQLHKTWSQKWLIYKQFSPTNMISQGKEGAEDSNSESESIESNMRPVGGVAAALGDATVNGRLFCFLPMPLESMLPVHINGHFLIDDSRKHLEKSLKERMNWNISLAQNVLAPCYVDLLLHALEMTQNGEVGEEWFYKLFPSLRIEGEVGNLKLPESAYNILYQRNPPILLQKHPDSGDKKWLTLRGRNMGYFLLSFTSKDTGKKVDIDPELHCALLKLGMPVVTDEVPLTLYENFNMCHEQSVTHVTPELMVNHLKNKCSKTQMEAVLTSQTAQCFLQFIIDSRRIKYLKTTLYSVPLLLTCNNCLWKGTTIFKSKYASLLPHCSDHFILQDLEESPVGILLAGYDYGVIVDLPVEFVRDNIDMPNEIQPVKLSDVSNETLELVRNLWFYIKSMFYGGIRDVIAENFPSKPLLPADDGHLYPMSLGATVLCSSIEAVDQNIRKSLTKLGYPTISFDALKMSNPYGLVNPCVNGRDIINCFKLKPPINTDADLSHSEVRRIIESIRDLPELKDIKTILQRLKIFKTVNGGFMSMVRNPRVFVMPHDVPRGGIDTIQECCKAQFVILDASDELTMNFYKDVLYNVGDDKVLLYRQIILPHLHKLPVDYIQNHLKNIMCNSDLTRPLQQDLREIKFIKLPSGDFCRVNELCHPHDTFFQTFCSNILLPEPWEKEIDTWLNFFKDLGFRHEVTNQDWIRHSRLFATKSSEQDSDTVTTRSRVLLYTFFKKINCNHFSRNELRQIAMIPFIKNCDPEPLLIQEVNMLFKTKHNISKQLFCFRGSIFSSNGHLGALCKNILPSRCDDFLKGVCGSLEIENPVLAQTIASNLKKLSSAYTCVQMSGNQSGSTSYLREILLQHFQELNTLALCQNDVSELKETLCVAVSLPQSFQRLILVKPSQLIREIPSVIELQPFYYKVPQEIAACERVLDVFGIPREMSAHHCVAILLNIYKQLKQTESNLSSHNRFKRIALYSYDQLVCILRKGCHECLPQQLFLPSEDDELLPHDKLVFNNAPWFAQRLKNGEIFKFLKLPPPDSNGEKIPPDSLGVKKLTSLVSEELHPEMESEEWACNRKLLYAQDNHKPRCIVVQNILQTLQSKEMKDGLFRVYYSERQERPPKQFEQTVQRLQSVQITCVTSQGIPTVLKMGGEVIEGSKSTDKHCLALVGANRLVIAPHDNCKEVDFIQHLSKAVNSLLQNEIKNEAYLASMLKCSPEHIERELDKEQVVHYDPNTIKETKYLQAGEEVSFNHLTFADCLLILNFNAGEIVCYYDEQKKMIVTAKVLNVRNSTSYNEATVTLSLKETEEPNDENESIVRVSPANIFKILTPPQKIVLVSDTTDESEVRATAEPLLFAPLSCDSEDLASILESDFFKNVPKDLAMTRLIAHVHYLKTKQSKQLNTKVVPFLEKLNQFLAAENPLLPLVNYILRIIKNDLEVPTPAMDIQQRPFEGHAFSSIHYSIPSHQSFSGSANVFSCDSYGGGGSGTRHSGMGIQPAMVPHYTTPPPLQQTSRFQPPPRRTGQRSHYRPHRYYRFQSSYGQPQPPPPPTSERDAQIWLDQAKMDYRAALFMMGVTKITPAQTVLEPDLSKESEVETVSSLESHSSASIVSSQSEHLYEGGDEEKSLYFDAVAGDLELVGKERVTGEAVPLLESRSSVSLISSLHSEHEEDSSMEHNSTQFPSVVCFLCHEAVEKSMKGVMYAYCGLSSNLVNCSGLTSILQQIKDSSHFPKELIQPIENCVMRVCEHQSKSRYPNFQILPCAPAIAYTNADAREALMATRQLLCSLMEDKKIAPIIKDLEELPIPQFTSMLKSLGGNNGK